MVDSVSLERRSQGPDVSHRLLPLQDRNSLLDFGDEIVGPALGGRTRGYVRRDGYRLFDGSRLHRALANEDALRCTRDEKPAYRVARERSDAEARQPVVRRGPRLPAILALEDPFAVRAGDDVLPVRGDQESPNPGVGKRERLRPRGAVVL